MNREDLKKLGKTLSKFIEIKKGDPGRSNREAMCEAVSFIRDKDNKRE